jgi:hypothetical protein
MREEFQSVEWAEPPVGDLVEKAVAQGRRMRTARRVRIAGAGLAVLAVAGVATGAVVRETGGSAPAPAAVSVAAPASSASSAAPATPAAQRVKATPAGVLELLTQNLPAGQTSHYVGDVLDKDTTAVQLHLTRNGKTGLVLLDVINWKQPWAGSWTPLGKGVSYRVIENPGNCIQPTIVLVRHPDNTLLQFNLSTCTKHGTKQTPQILTVKEAAQAGADPRWGVTVDPAINQKGAADFAHLSKNFG